MFNWRPVYDIEQETERLKIRSRESEKRLRAFRAGALFLLEPNLLQRRFPAYIANELVGPK